MNEKLANTLIDLGVEINTYQDGDAFVKTYQFNDAQLLAFREEAYQAGLRRALALVDEHDPNVGWRDTNPKFWGNTLRTALSEEIKSNEK